MLELFILGVALPVLLPFLMGFILSRYCTGADRHNIHHNTSKRV